jgi:hypothetical protein
MAMQIRLRGQQLSDLESIREIPAERLRALAQQLEDQVPPPLTPAELEVIVRNVLGGDSEMTQSLMRQLLSLSSLRWHRNLEADDILTGLLHAVTVSENPWTEGQLDCWRAMEQELRHLLDHPRVAIVSKALDLSYDYANLLQEARIVTDIRPIFDRDVTEMEGAVVSFTLRLQYDSTDGNHGMSIAMNLDDVQELVEECNRAIRKSTMAAAIMNQRGQIRTIISGADDDVSD